MMAQPIPPITLPKMPDMTAVLNWLIAQINTQNVSGTTPVAWNPNS
jgi:hypothetical protein